MARTHARALDARRQAQPRPSQAPTARTVARDVRPSQVPAYAYEALSVLLEAGKQAFVVGGFVRDALRGVPAHDVDVATDALWYQTREIFAERGYRVVETGVRHGTVTVFIGGRPVEITTFRSDGTYSDHRRPDTVRYVRDVEDDLARRDFTVNAMAWSPNGGLRDPFGGRDDLAAGVVRAVGDPDRRFEEDALRLMRGVRFASKLGFSVEKGTAEAIHRHVGDLAYVASERIAVEYDGIVCGPGAVAALRAYPDVVCAAAPPIREMVGFDQHSVWHSYDVWEHCLHALDALEPEAGPLVRHVTLLHDMGKPGTFTMGPDRRGHFYGHEELGARMARKVFADLHWRAADVGRAATLVQLHDYRIDPTPRGIRRILARLSRAFAGAEAEAGELFVQLLQVKRADTLAHAPGCVERRLEELAQLRAVYEGLLLEEAVFCLRDLAVGGADVVAAGVAPGPEVGRTLRRLLSAVVDGRLPNDRDVLLVELAACRGAAR
jgi:tRNA nucleotidyltransferase (CCA-adding enzyme)